MMKLRFATPDTLVDINRLEGLDGISAADGHIEIQALVRHDDIVASDVVSAESAAMASAAPLDRRPHSSQPRHALRLGRPSRSRGRLGIRDARCRRRCRRRKP